MNKNTVIGLLLAVIVYLLLYRGDPNSKPIYGDTGCRETAGRMFKS